MPGFDGPELCALTARAAVDLLRKGEITPQDLIEASVARIEQTSPAINAMITTCPDRAHEAAQQVTADSPLAGLPIGIKDLTPVKDVRSTFGTPGLTNHIPAQSDPLVETLERRGAVVIGKTNTPEMGAGANTFNAVFGPTRNPWDTRMNAGGSSGGAAAGLAAGEVWLSHGSDLGGSLRTPASFCGIVGLRPSPGLVGGSYATMSFSAMPVEGPMARNVADCALFLDAMTGYNPVWPLSYPADTTGYLGTCLQDPGRIRIGFSPDLNGLAPVTPEMAQILRSGVERLQSPTVDITETSPKIKSVDSSFRALRAFAMWTSFRHTPTAISDHYKPTLKQNIQDGKALTLDQLGDAEVARTRLYDAMQGFFEHHDVLACPVTGIAPLPVEIEYPPEINGIPSRDYLDWLRFAFLATLCGLPALSLPIGHTQAGLPVGLQLIGPPRGEARLLQIAHHFEQALGGPMTPINPNVTL